MHCLHRFAKFRRPWSNAQLIWIFYKTTFSLRMRGLRWPIKKRLIVSNQKSIHIPISPIPWITTSSSFMCRYRSVLSHFCCCAASGVDVVPVLLLLLSSQGINGQNCFSPFTKLTNPPPIDPSIHCTLKDTTVQIAYSPSCPGCSHCRVAHLATIYYCHYILQKTFSMHS